MKKVCKSMLGVFLVVIILFLTIRVSYAKNSVLTGEPNFQFACELDTETGTLTIGGLGMLFAGDIESALNINDLSIVKEIVIKEGVSLIHLTSWYSQPNFNNVKKITLPKTLKRIAMSTFENCKSLERIDYGGSESDWNELIIDEGNKSIKKSIVEFNCTVPKTKGADEFDYSFMVERNYGEKFKCSVDYYTGVLTIAPQKTFEKDCFDNMSLGDLFKSLIYKVKSKNCRVDMNLANLFPIETKYFDGYYADYMIKSVVFESGITEIGKNVLMNQYVESVFVPGTVKKFYDECFGDSNSYEKSLLKKVYYEGSITDWNEIKVGDNNIPLIKAEKSYGTRISAKELTYTLSEKNYIFDGKAHSPLVTIKDMHGNVLESNEHYSVYSSDVANITGKYKMVVKLKGGYKGQKTLYYFIRPQAPSILKVLKKTEGFTVVWNKLNTEEMGDVDRYEIQYSTSLNFKEAEIITMKNCNSYEKTIAGLKSNEKYYVRIRAVTKVDGGYIRSSWSKTKRIKID